MPTITVFAGTTPVQVDEETYEIVTLMIEEISRSVATEDLFDVVQLLSADGYPNSAITIALAAKQQVESDNYWTDQIIDDAVFAAEQGAQ